MVVAVLVGLVLKMLVFLHFLKVDLIIGQNLSNFGQKVNYITKLSILKHKFLILKPSLNPYNILPYIFLLA